LIRLLDVVSRTATEVIFKTPEISNVDTIPYIVYDTSTGVVNMEDYVAWRSLTFTSTGSTDLYFRINNTCLYPSYLDPITDYTTLRPALFKVMSFTEYNILQHVLTRLDLVRRRLPNPGYTVSSTNSVGQNGTVSMSGGFDKKFAVTELVQMIEGAIIEINWTSPMTYFWPLYMTAGQEAQTNPYSRSEGLPFAMVDLITQGAILRALAAWGILEIDMSFSTSDSGLQITFDRVQHVQSWHSALLADYQKQKDVFKMNFANHSGVGIGSTPYALQGIFGTALNNVSAGGNLSMTSLLGWQMARPL
jgi:hypothetical protein